MNGLKKKLLPIIAGCIFFLISSLNAFAANTGNISLNNLSRMDYTTISGGTITNQAKEKPKIMVYLRETGICGLSNGFVRNIQSLNCSSVDMVVVGVENYTADTLKAFKKTYGPSNNDIIYAYSPIGYAKSNMFSYSSLVSDSNYVTFPVVIYIDKDNRIREIDVGDYTGTTVVSNCKKYFNVNIEKAGSSENNQNTNTETGTIKEKVNSKNVTVSNLTYTGKSLIPQIKAVDSKGKTISSSNYTYTVSPKTLKKIGKYTINIKFKGNYKGTVTKKFYITPKKPSITFEKIDGSNLKIKYSKVTGAGKYEIQCSSDESFENGKITSKINGINSLSATIKDLDAGSTVYVRVRTLKTVSGKKIYSEWSNVSKISIPDNSTPNNPTQNNTGTKRILNVSTKKYHEENCRSVKQMSDSNKKISYESSDQLIKQGYSPCKICNP